VRVLGREPGDLVATVRKRIAAAVGRRAAIAAQSDAYRVVNGEGDGLPGLVVDRYAGVAVVRLYSKAWERHLPLLIQELSPRFPAGWRRYGVERVDGRDGGEALWGPDPGDAVVVTEHGARLLARVKTGQKTGLFLDQREHRRLVRDWARGRTVVNLFSYNGGFSVAAALGGARRVVSVDIAPAAIDDARENFRLNGLDPDRHGFEVADAFRWAGERPELLVCDPPSLAHERAHDSSARRAYRDLHRHVGALPTELLATSSCTARLPFDRWEDEVRDGLKGGWTVLHRGTEPADHPVGLAHPEGRYLKFMLLSRV
jgi:23S rRNA (cytosine1962-C5)-methyltransferase